MKTPGPLVIATLLCLLAASTTVLAQGTARDLASASLEELMRIEITSANRKEQEIENVAAAVYVLTQDDIRRSGIRTLPELFRLVPGMQVAQVNSNKWAVSARGFNDLFSNKVLILIDGRSIYKRTFSGVFWHAEGLMLEDIDRIEVIRGPGGATWGANAVNGVINIITKSAADTQGALVRLGAGSYDRADGAVRYGGRINGVDYRVFGIWADHGEGELDGEDAGDDWRQAKAGLRADWARGGHRLMLKAGVLESNQHGLWIHHSGVPGTLPGIDRSASSATTASLLGRWTYQLRPATSLSVQSFYSRQHLVDPNERETETAADVEGELHLTRGRHDVIVGAGFRTAHHTDDGGSFSFRLIDVEPRNHVGSVFAQDEIKVGRVWLTGGAKVEHDSTAGWSLQPTGRALWESPSNRHHVWGAVSRAVRTPSLTELNLRLNFTIVPGPQGTPIVIGQVGNPEALVEDFVNMETGYRLLLDRRASIEVSTFVGDYDHLLTLEPQAPVFETTPEPAHLFVYSRYENLLEAKTQGIEVTARLAPAAAWRLEASYSGFHITPRPDADSRDPDAATFDGNAPAHQFQLRSSWAFGRRAELNANLFRVGQLRVLQIPAYTRADVRAEYQLSPRFSLALTGQNLTDAAHAEFAMPAVASTLVRRNVHVGLTWRLGR